MNAEIMNDPDCAEQHAESEERRKDEKPRRIMTYYGWKPAGVKAWTLYERTKDAWKKVVAARYEPEHGDLLDRALDLEDELRELLRGVE